MSASRFSLYVFPISPNGRKVLAVARHLGLQPEVRIVDLLKLEQRSPEFLAINPNGKNPALIDGDFRLWESNAILQYMSEKYAGGRLWGHDAQSRADVSRWLFWESSEWLPSISPMVFERMVKPMFQPDAVPDQAVIQRASERFGLTAPVLEQQLRKGPFITGDEPSLADFSVAALLTYWQAGQVPLHGYPNILAWLARMHEIPAWKETAPQMQPPK